MSSPPEGPGARPLRERVTVFAEELLAENPPPGLALHAGGETVVEAGFGVGDVEAGWPVTPDTAFGIASVAKGFTALAVTQRGTDAL